MNKVISTVGMLPPITQSMMKDWINVQEGKGCPKFFEAKYLTKTAEREEKEVFAWGLAFEAMALGSNAKEQFEATEKMRKSVTYGRMLEQVDRFRQMCKELNVTDIEPQERLSRIMYFTIEDRLIQFEIEGTLDFRCKMDGVRKTIDLKFSGDAYNSFGDYSWGFIETMDHTQALHYSLLDKLDLMHRGLVTNDTPYNPFEYWLFDHTPRTNVRRLMPLITEESMNRHKENLVSVWTDLYDCHVNGFEPKPRFNQCRVCLAKCDQEIGFPEIEEFAV